MTIRTTHQIRDGSGSATPLWDPTPGPGPGSGIWSLHKDLNWEDGRKGTGGREEGGREEVLVGGVQGRKRVLYPHGKVRPFLRSEESFPVRFLFYPTTQRS